MLALDWNLGTPEWTVLTYTGAHLAWIDSGPANQVLNAGKVRRVALNDDQLLAIIRSSDQTTSPPPTLTPAMAAVWGDG